MERVYKLCFVAGISRLERWERAAKFGFDPPKEVRDVVLQHKDDTKYTEK